MKISKIIASAILTLSVAGTVGVGYSVKASTTTTTDRITREVNLEFANLQDSDKVIPQADGGYLYTANSASDSSAVTVAQAKTNIIASYETSLQKTSSALTIVPLSTSYPVTAKALSPGDTYYSDTFSGSGWKYSGYKFYNTSGSHYMLWENVNASGQVMDAGGTVLKYLGADASFVSVYDSYSIYQIYGIQNPGSSAAFYVVTGE
ncbi:hypothetical protein [Lactococcus allomyrinae]|uniref:Uncharacterized protein n=1 Tax=Lactococcus allomyrinae TaxID=2419773 RepID=A0A387BJD4_9LACT|nr:hypothetical protein [Lactococcus allomyrinae]AYG01040.1 hypothetical protein D7I46_08040 [Lactococcus allomyrinae]